MLISVFPLQRRDKEGCMIDSAATQCKDQKKLGNNA